jgi:hypothetical protein
VRRSGKSSISPAAARQAAASGHGSELPVTELVRAFAYLRLDGSDLRLQAWAEAFGQQSPWPSPDSRAHNQERQRTARPGSVFAQDDRVTDPAFVPEATPEALLFEALVPGQAIHAA